LGRGVGLRVKAVHVGKTTLKVDVDYGLRPGFDLASRVGGPDSLQFEERAERQAECAEPANANQVATRRAGEMRSVGGPSSRLRVSHRTVSLAFWIALAEAGQ